MALDRREHFAFDLADVGGYRLPQTALAARHDLRARRRLEILAELVNLVPSQGQVNGPVCDLRDLLGRHVPRLSERARRYRETIEDVLGVVTCHLVDFADLAAVSSKYLPAGSDHQPRDRIGHGIQVLQRLAVGDREKLFESNDASLLASTAPASQLSRTAEGLGKNRFVDAYRADVGLPTRRSRTRDERADPLPRGIDPVHRS